MIDRAHYRLGLSRLAHLIVVHLIQKILFAILQDGKLLLILPRLARGHLECGLDCDLVQLLPVNVGVLPLIYDSALVVSELHCLVFVALRLQRLL